MTNNICFKCLYGYLNSETLRYGHGFPENKAASGISYLKGFFENYISDPSYEVSNWIILGGGERGGAGLTGENGTSEVLSFEIK